MRSLLSGLAVVAVVGACTPKAREGTTPGTDRSVITQAQFANYHFNTAYDAVASLRANWMNNRGPDSPTATQVRVYLDEALYGDVTSLRTIGVTNIAYIKYFDGIAATSRWGLDHGAGVIYVSTRPPAAGQKP